MSNKIPINPTYFSTPLNNDPGNNKRAVFKDPRKSLKLIEIPKSIDKVDIS